MAIPRPMLPDGEHFGTLAELPSPEALCQACERVREAGYTRWDAHAPFPVAGLDCGVGSPRSRLRWIPLVLALAGAAIGLGLQGWVGAIAYPLVVSGESLFGWPVSLPIALALALLGAAAGAVLRLFALIRLPTLYHPLFGSSAFERASDDGFFLSIESGDPEFDADATPELLRRSGATNVELIPS